jgi:ribonuclease R
MQNPPSSPKQRNDATLAIIRERGLPADFEPATLAEAAAFRPDPDPADVEKEIGRGRRDLRDLNLMTIDGEDAKDLDDAVSIEALPDGRYRLGVHIADVTHYVMEGGALDEEALRRGTSTYLADRVIPMLPPRLSNGTCSLNPDVDRLTLSVILVVDPTGEIEQGEIVETVIRSKARATYSEVRQALDTDLQPSGRYPGFLDDLRLMRQLAGLFAARRRRRGAIDFAFPETHVIVDDQGWPTVIEPYPISFANGIIEEFMIAANEFVARHGEQHRLPFLYRVHEQPDPDKLARFLRLAKNLGVKARVHGQPTPGQLAGILEQVKQETFGTTLAELLLRSLAKARYSAVNLGHFGLASDCYCHFTSPIRRYPDLFIHRVIKAGLHGRSSPSHWQALAAQAAEQCSGTERTAMLAERDSVDLMSAIYLSSRLGEIYPGVVSGFGPAGIYIRLESTIEGLVPFRSLPGFLIYDEDRMEAADQSRSQVFNLGDAVDVQVARADPATRQIDFELLTHRGVAREQRPAKSARQAKASQKSKDAKKGRVGKTAASIRRKSSRKRH